MIDKIKVQNQVFEINDTALRSKVNLIDEKLSDTSADLELLQTEVESVERISLENSRNIDNIEIELDEKASKEELVNYQHKLTAGQNITIENNVISATGGGSSDYNQLTNKPSLNGQELIGDVTVDIPTKTSELINDSNFVVKTYVDDADKELDDKIKDLQSSRMVVDMSNIDEAGVDYLKELIEESSSGGGSDAPVIHIKLNTSFSEYDNNSDKTSYITNKQEIGTQIKKLYDLGCHTFNIYLEFIGSDNANYSMLYQGGQFSKKSLLQKPTSMVFTDFFTSNTDTTSSYYQAFFNSKMTLTLTWSEDVPTLTKLQFTSGRFTVPSTTYSLSKTNTTAYVPTSTYHPATKGYVDDATGGIVGEMTSLILDEGFKRKGTNPQPITLSFASDKFTDRGNNVYYYSTTGATINANGTITVTTENDCYLSIHYTAYPDAPFIMYEVDSTSVVRYKDDVPKNVDTIYNYLVPAGTHTIYLTYYKQTGYSGGTKAITLTLPTEGYNVEDFKVASENYVDSKIGEITTVLATLTTPEEG